MTPIEVVATTFPFWSVERTALESELVNQAEPVTERFVVEALSAVRGPTTVDDACETKPPLRVERPFTESVPKVPVLAFAAVEVAVPKVPTPETVSVPMLPVLPLTVVEVEVVKKAVVPEIAVVEAYGKMLARVVLVATT